MKIDTDKFLKMTAILAGTTLGVACSSSDSNGNNGAGDASTGGSSSGGKASGGAGASTGGKSVGGTGGGTAGAGGSSGTAGAGGASGGRDAGSGGGGTDAGSGGGGTTGSGGTDSGTGPACLGDTPPPVEAGAPDPCTSLPATLTNCGDAGVEGVLAPALAVCYDTQFSLRPGVFAALVECLKSGTAPANACNAAAKTHALGCFDTVVGKACAHPLDAGANPCAAFTAACPAITAKTCNDVFNAFSQEAIGGQLTACLQAAMPVRDAGTDAGASCGFWQCVMGDITR